MYEQHRSRYEPGKGTTEVRKSYRNSPSRHWKLITRTNVRSVKELLYIYCNYKGMLPVQLCTSNYLNKTCKQAHSTSKHILFVKCPNPFIFEKDHKRPPQKTISAG